MIIQDLFRYRIISSLAAGESSDIASKLIGERMINYLERNATPAKDDARKWIMKSERRPIISTSTLQGSLGVKVLVNGKKQSRAVVIGLKDVYRIDWPITLWPRVREGYVPARWLDEVSTKAEPTKKPK